MGRVQISGGLKREIHVSLQPVRMRSLDISAGQVVSALQQQNLDAPAGRMEHGNSEFLVRVVGRIHKPEDFANIILADRGGERNEEVFVYVDSIKAGIVYGRIASELTAVRSYRQGQRMSFPESEVWDWTIIHPDGSEEGNYVGKFIDTYKPR